MTNKTFCKSCRIPTRQLCVKSSAFQDVEASDLEQQFLQWNGVIHVCKKQEQDCAYVHFASDDLASVRYHSRDNATLNGEKVNILSAFKNNEPLHYSQPPISFSPSPALLTLAFEPQEQQQPQKKPQKPPQQQSQQQLQQQLQQQSLRQSQHNAFNSRIKENLVEVDDMLRVYEEEIQVLRKKRKTMEELLYD